MGDAESYLDNLIEPTYCDKVEQAIECGECIFCDEDGGCLYEPAMMENPYKGNLPERKVEHGRSGKG